MKHHELWYIRRLQCYYNEHFLEFDEYVEWFANPKPNTWKFKIPRFGMTVILTCDDEGNVSEERG